MMPAIKSPPFSSTWWNARGGINGLEIRNSFISEREVRHWNRLPSLAVGSLSLEVFKERVDVV